MKDEIISLKTEDLAKQAGFTEPCLLAYDGSDMLSSYTNNPFELLNYNRPGGTQRSAPTQALLARWLREKHSLHVNAQHNMFFYWQVQVQDIFGPSPVERLVDQKWLAHDYATYEEAMEVGLQHALTILNSL